VQVLRWLAILVAALLLYVAAFLREDEEGALQNRLERLWLVIDDLSRGAISRHTAFLQQTAGAALRALDCLLGKRLLSFQSAGVSACLSMASISLAAVTADAIFHLQSPYAKWVGFVLYISAGYAPTTVMLSHSHRVVLGVVLVVAACCPLFTSRLRSVPSVMAVTMFVVATSYYIADSGESIALADALFFALALVCGIAADLLFVTFVRATLAFVQKATAVRITITVVAHAVVATFLTIGLIALHGWHVEIDFNVPYVESYYVSWRRLAAMVASSDLFVLPVAMLFVFVAITLLLHRLLWPVLSRPLYSVQRYGIFAHRRVLAAAALLLGATAASGPTRVFRAIIELFIK
jgi:hypothetical protein